MADVQPLSPGLGDFFNYNEKSADPVKAVRNDVTQAIITEYFERDFARFEGAGIEMMENELDDPLVKILVSSRIAMAIGNYNAGVTLDKQVITSQQMIDILSASDLDRKEAADVPPATWYIRVRYMMTSKVQNRDYSVYSIVLPANPSQL